MYQISCLYDFSIKGYGVWNHVYELEISKEELSYSQQQKPLTDSHGKIGKDERFTKWNICTRVLDVVSFVLFFLYKIESNREYEKVKFSCTV